MVEKVSVRLLILINSLLLNAPQPSSPLWSGPSSTSCVFLLWLNPSDFFILNHTRIQPTYLNVSWATSKVTQRYFVPLDIKQSKHHSFSLIGGHCAWKTLNRMSRQYSIWVGALFYRSNCPHLIPLQVATGANLLQPHPLWILTKSGQVCF